MLPDGSIPDPLRLLPVAHHLHTPCHSPLQGDPYKTLFVARLSYEVTERRLATEFGEFGPIKRIRLVHNKTNGEGTQRAVTGAASWWLGHNGPP